MYTLYVYIYIICVFLDDCYYIYTHCTYMMELLPPTDIAWRDAVTTWCQYHEKVLHKAPIFECCTNYGLSMGSHDYYRCRYIYIIYYIQTYLFFSLSLYISLWNSKLRQVRMPSDTIPPTNKFTLLLGVVRQLPCKEWPIRRLEFWRCSIIFPYFPYFSD